MADADIPDKFPPAIRWVISGIVLFVFFLVAVEKANEGHYGLAAINAVIFAIALIVAVKWNSLIAMWPGRRRQLALTLIVLGAALLALGIALLAYQTETAASLPAISRSPTQSSANAPELEAMQRTLDSKAQELDIAKRELDTLRTAARAKTHYSDAERDDTIHLLLEWRPAVEAALQAVRAMRATAAQYDALQIQMMSWREAGGTAEWRHEQDTKRRNEYLTKQREQFDSRWEQVRASTKAARELWSNRERHPRRISALVDPLLESVAAAPHQNVTPVEAAAQSAIMGYQQQILGGGTRIGSQFLVEKLEPYEQQLAGLISKVDVAVTQAREK
jgi:hypothetical protein